MIMTFTVYCIIMVSFETTVRATHSPQHHPHIGINNRYITTHHPYLTVHYNNPIETNMSWVLSVWYLLYPFIVYCFTSSKHLLWAKLDSTWDYLSIQTSLCAVNSFLIFCSWCMYFVNSASFSQIFLWYFYIFTKNKGNKRVIHYGLS